MLHILTVISGEREEGNTERRTGDVVFHRSSKAGKFFKDYRIPIKPRCPVAIVVDSFLGFCVALLLLLLHQKATSVILAVYSFVCWLHIPPSFSRWKLFRTMCQMLCDHTAEFSRQQWVRFPSCPSVRRGMGGCGNVPEKLWLFLWGFRWMDPVCPVWANTHDTGAQVTICDRIRWAQYLFFVGVISQRNSFEHISFYGTNVCVTYLHFISYTHCMRSYFEQTEQYITLQNKF